MASPAEAAEFGALAPGVLDKAVIALTSRLPDNWVGQRLAVLLRRITTMRLDYPAGALDVVRWGMRLRLHPRDNGCEKNLLFTPQMYEPAELAALASHVDRVKAKNRDFIFIDIGANVGLFSFFVAARAGTRTRILAVEPEPGNLARLSFNVEANPGAPVRPIPLALGDEAGELAIELHQRDRGGTRTRKITDHGSKNETRVEVRTLLQLVRDENIGAIDAIKIDVEGAEGAILRPFFRNAPKSLWPQLLLIEDGRDLRAADLFSFLAEIGFVVAGRTKLNVILHRE
jgi:FkbM family methyltransferase